MQFFYYLCCCGCFGLFGKRKLRTTKTSQKRRKLVILESIATNQKPMPITSDPEEKAMEELTDIHRIPTDIFPTEESVIDWYGFKIISPIAEGSFAHVYEAIHIQTYAVVACKRIPILDYKKHTQNTHKPTDHKKIARLKDIKNELFILQEMKHPNVIKMIRHFIIEMNKTRTLYVFTELATKGTLTKCLATNGPFDENMCKYWFAQMLSAMYYMHSKGIAHRDLKLSNILLDDTDDILISDFGLSRIAYRKSKGGVLESNTYCGTPPFMAPELFERKPYNAFLVDVWALGVILYRLYCKEYPFNTDKREESLHKMKTRGWKLSNKIIAIPTNQMTDIIKQMLEPDTTLRPVIRNLRKHPWIKKEFKKIDKNALRIIAKTIKSPQTAKSMKTTQKTIN